MSAKKRVGRPAADPGDAATVSKTWRARPSDLALLADLRKRVSGTEGEVIRKALVVYKMVLDLPTPTLDGDLSASDAMALAVAEGRAHREEPLR